MHRIGLVMELHDICPSYRADVCTFSSMGEDLYISIINPFAAEIEDERWAYTP